jgi:hypothetical protein
MIRRIASAVLIVLAFSPVTAPFAACDLVDLLHSHHDSGRTASLQAPSADSDSDALTVPPLVTKEGQVQTRQAATIEPISAASNIELIPIATRRAIIRNLVVHRDPPHTASVLRV